MTTAITERTETLPETVKELIDFVIIGNEAIKGFKAKLRACTKAEVANDARKIALRDGKRVSRLVYDAEIRLGELLSKTEREYVGSIEGTNVPQQKKTLPSGINKKDSHYAQEFYRHKEVVDRTWEEKQNDIPTIHDGLKAIKQYKKEEIRNDNEEQGKNIDPKKIGITFKHGDFTEVLDDIPDQSIDLILTDPPYPIDFIDEWKKLGEFAEKKLKANGFLVAYCGHKNLFESMERLNSYLDYYWIFGLVHSGNTQLIKFNNIEANWKPILVYQNGYKKLEQRTKDLIQGSGRSKFSHDWEQSLDELEGLIKSFSKKQQIIVDPFAGSGTVLVASKKLNRVSIGAERDEKTYNIARKKIGDAFEEFQS